MATCEPLEWSVKLPDKQAYALGRKRPRARLTIGEDETFEIPKLVGKRLNREKREKKVFSSRAELLYHLRELSKTCAHDKMEYLINQREYSSAELKQKLLDDGYLPDVVQGIVERAQEVGIVSDRRYVESFITSKVYAGWGRTRIVRELKHRGIAVDEIDGLYDLLPSDEDEYERAYDAASKRRLTGTNDYQKLMHFLMLIYRA